MELRFLYTLFFSLTGFFMCGLSFGQYYMIVETEESIKSGMLRHHIYIQCEHSSDRISAIYGTDLTPMWIDAPEGVFNSPFNGGWSAAGMNPLLYESMPTLQDDSYATISLTAPANKSAEGSQNPMMVEDRSHPWSDFFKENGATRLEINTLIGGSWFAVKSASNGLPDEKNRVLISQITTSGSIRGEVNAQIFPRGNGMDSIKVKFDFDGVGKTQGQEI